MGQIFEFIADAALEVLDDYYTECHVCNSTGVDLYTYQGKLMLEDGTVDDDIYAVCADCIKTQPLIPSGEWAYSQTIRDYLTAQQTTPQAYDALLQKLLKQYRQTPQLPLFLQYDDRPLCCNTLTEFTGYPADEKELFHITENNTYWEKQVAEKSEYMDFRKYGLPEGERDIAAFRCPACNKAYFTFQFT
ncbi:hypothetical protein [Niabella beijingensis]|uniref:hypothetical protein n=1 Tax=Niabella beijingensis TaxID=2872700 RepID=UPI001CBE4FE5|nr:hypothetical protein [Niabella beijingensis]MBZ4187258.1 hypothetical protein [Niabella beijingensis]